MKRIKIKTAAIVAAIASVLVIGGGTAFAVTTTAASAKPASASNLYGCVSGSSREIVGVYTVAGNFKTCPSGSFAITVASGVNGKNGTNGAPGAKGATGATGAQGSKGDIGATGPAGSAGADGANGLTGAYYSVAKYDVGDTNGGAVATVKCKESTDVAISGGVQTLQLGTNSLGDNVPVSTSMPGVMDWSTNTPVAGSLNGWIVQFGGNSSNTSLGDPKYVDVYVLCVPGADIPVDTTYTESGS